MAQPSCLLKRVASKSPAVYYVAGLDLMLFLWIIESFFS